MPERDKRWANMYASFKDPEITPEEFEQGVKAEDWLEIRITVWYEGWYFYNAQRIHRDDYAEIINPNHEIYTWVLTHMVESIDRYMEEKGVAA